MNKLFFEAVKSIYDFTDEEAEIYLKGFREEKIEELTEEFKDAVKKIWYKK